MSHLKSLGRWRKLLKEVLSNLHTNEGGSVGWERSGQSWTHTWEEGLDTTLAVDLLGGSSDRNVDVGRLLGRLDGVNWENTEPHGNTSKTTGNRNGTQRQVLTWSGQLLLQDLVGSKVKSRTWTVSGQSSSGTLENGSDTTGLVHLSNDRTHSGLLTVSNLHHNLDSLEWSSDQSSWNSRDETSSRGLTNSKVLGLLASVRTDNLLTHVVTPEGNSEHRSNTQQWRQHTSVETKSTVLGQGALKTLGGGLVNTSLQTNLDQVEWVAS